MAQLTQTVVNGQVGLLSSRQFLAGSGKYYTITNPTPGTAIVWANLTSFSATANGLFLLQNKNPIGGANLYLDRMTLRQTATAPTGTLSLNFDIWNEQGLVTGTGNVATRTPVNINTSGTQGTGAFVQSFAAGAITIPAAVGSRVLQDITSIPTGVTVIHDTFVVDFGADGPAAGASGLTAARATDPTRLTTQAAPIVIAPQTTSWVNAWWVTAAANTPSLEFSLSYIEV